MNLLIPANRVCSGKATRYPVTGVKPVLWIKAGSERYTVAGIDGFIVTREKQVNGIFKKFEYTAASPGETISIENISSVFHENEIRLIRDFSTTMGCGFYTFIWPKDFPAGFDKDAPLIHSCIFDFADQGLEIKTHKLLSLAELESGICRLRGYSFNAVKPLNMASSNVECYLANNTRNPWPGDIDAIIYDQARKKYIAIIEFKTHNNPASPVAGEHIGKYGREDWRRFDVLFDLKDNFQSRLGYSPKLLYIVWGTQPASPHHSDIKIDLVERDRVLQSHLFPRPANHSFSPDLFNFILRITDEASI